MNKAYQKNLTFLVTNSNSSFPEGGFAYPWGVKDNIGKGIIFDLPSALLWARNQIEEELLALDIKALDMAWELGAFKAYDALIQINNNLVYEKKSIVGSMASAEVGKRLMENLYVAYEYQEFIQLRKMIKKLDSMTVIQHSILWGAVANWMNIKKSDAIHIFIYNTISQWASQLEKQLEWGEENTEKFRSEILSFLSEFQYTTPEKTPAKSIIDEEALAQYI